MMQTHLRRRMGAALILLASATNVAFAGDEPRDSTPTYTWVTLFDCKLPNRAPPPLPRESYFLYNTQRRFLDLDRNGQCIVMDVWLERYRSIPYSVSRMLVKRFYRFNGKRWIKFSAHYLNYFPYALQSTDGATVFIEAAMPSDVSDQMALGIIEPRVFQAPPGQKSLFGKISDAGFSELNPYQGDARPIILSLAAILSDRLASGRVFTEEPPYVQPGFGADRDTERARIDMLTKAANQPAAKFHSVK